MWSDDCISGHSIAGGGGTPGSFQLGSKMSALSRGAMIVFEGCDRCGKSTQSLKLVEYLQSLGRRVQLFRFPG